MGLLNHLFGNEKGIATELAMDDEKRVAAWDEHLRKYAEREQLSKHFNFGNIDSALQDFDATLKVLARMEELISPELVSIASEVKTDEEIVADLGRLKSKGDLESLAHSVVVAKKKEAGLLELFRETHNVLTSELHLIRLIRRKPGNVRDLLLKLFELVFHHEDRLYKVFMEKSYFDENKHVHEYIMRMTRSIILQEEIKEEEETFEERFVKEMVKKMGPREPKRGYRKLAEDIYSDLAEMVGAPLPSYDEVVEGIKRMELIMKDDSTMFKVVKKLKPRYEDTKIRWVITAFRTSYKLGDLIDLEEGFYG